MWNRQRWGRGGHMGQGRLFESGDMRLALIALIVEQPRHGYDLMTELENRSDGAYRPSPGSIYPRLQQLEDEGLIASSRREGKNVYTATATGRAVVEEEQESIEVMWQRAEEWGDWGPASHPAAIEIARHVEIFARTAFIAVTKKDVDPDTVRQIIERARQEIEQSQMI